MTISTTIRSVDFSGNGSTTVFSVGFPWQQDADLVVTLINNSTSVETSWTLGVDYTLSGGDPSGTLTATVAPASGYTLHVERVVAYVQTLDLIDNDGFDAEANEATLDRIVQMIQQVADGSSGGGGSGGGLSIVNIGSGEGVSAGLSGTQYQLKSLKVVGSPLSIASDADSVTMTLGSVLVPSNNLSDVGTRQTALNTLTAVSAATNEYVLTKDTGTGNAIWKVVPAPGGGLLAANNLSDVGSAATSRTNLGLGTAAVLSDTVFAKVANNLSDLASVATARTNLGLGTAALLTTAQVLQSANNLSDIASAATARSNLGLGTAATFADTIFAKVANNLSDLANATTARTNLGLGTAAVLASTAVLQTANNLSDVGTRQTALNTLTAVGAATNEYVLTKDTGTGNAIWKVVPAPGGGLLAANNLSDVSTRQTALNNLTNVAAATNEWVLTKDTGTGNATFKAAAASVGEANTMSSAGGTHSIVLAKAGVNLPVKGFTAGSNVTITPSGTDLTIAATGEANTIASDANTGLSLIPATAKVGVELRTKGVGVGTGLSISASATDLTLSINQAATLAWTGAHTWTRNVGDAPDADGAFRSLNNGAMPHLSGNTLTSLYRTVVDIQKTTNASEGAVGNAQGGIAGLYVQHSVSGVAGASARLFTGTRSVIDNSATGTPTEAVAYYGTAANLGTNANAAWSFFCDVVHNNSSAGAVTRGFGAEVLRSNSAGVVYAYQAMNMTAGLQPNAGFTVQRQANATARFSTAFEVGNATGISSGVDADVGFDTAYGFIGTAAFRMAGGQRFRMDGALNTADMRFNASSTAFGGGTDDAIEMLTGGSTVTFAVRTDGVLGLAVSTSTNRGGGGAAVALPALPVGYLPVFINGTARKIPFYEF